MNKKVTIHDIARELGIASSTVSRALNDNSRISKKTRTLINNKAVEMGYQPNSLASALRTGKQKTLGVIVPYADRAFFGSVIGAVEEVVHAEGYQIILCQSNDMVRDEAKKVDLLLNTQVSGLLISVAPNNGEADHLQRVIDANIPLVMFDRVEDKVKACSVKLDDYSGAYNMVTHLINQGCSRIAHLAGDFRSNIYYERFRGYKQALVDHGMKFDQSLVRQRDCFVEQGYEATEDIFKGKIKPDGIFSATDYKAVGALKYLLKSGINVPGEVALAGFSNEPFVEHLVPSICTVDQKTREMGELAARFFLEMASNADQYEVKSVVLQPELVIRQSSLKASYASVDA